MQRYQGELICAHCIWIQYNGKKSNYDKHKYIPVIDPPIYKSSDVYVFSQKKFQYAISVINKIHSKPNTIYQIIQTLQICEYLYNKYKINDIRILINSNVNKLNIKDHPHTWIIMNSTTSRRIYDREFNTINGWGKQWLLKKNKIQTHPYKNDKCVNLSKSHIIKLTNYDHINKLFNELKIKIKELNDLFVYINDIEISTYKINEIKIVY